eukprot:1273769-Amphidinium_carterae.1
MDCTHSDRSAAEGCCADTARAIGPNDDRLRGVIYQRAHAEARCTVVASNHLLHSLSGGHLDNTSCPSCVMDGKIQQECMNLHEFA